MLNKNVPVHSSDNSLYLLHPLVRKDLNLQSSSSSVSIVSSISIPSESCRFSFCDFNVEISSLAPRICFFKEIISKSISSKFYNSFLFLLVVSRDLPSSWLILLVSKKVKIKQPIPHNSGSIILLFVNFKFIYVPLLICICKILTIFIIVSSIHKINTKVSRICQGINHLFWWSM